MFLTNKSPYFRNSEREPIKGVMPIVRYCDRRIRRRRS